MCWSYNASVSFFLIGIISCCILFLRNSKPLDRFYAIFFGWVVMMQLVEAMMWKDPECKNGVNRFASNMGWFLNLTQPLVLALLALNTQGIVHKKVLIVCILVYVIIFVNWILTKKPYNFCTKPLDTEGVYKHHLQWTWTQDSRYNKILIFYFILSIIAIMSFIKEPYGKMFMALWGGSLLVSSVFNPFNKAAGAWWCVFAASGPVIKLFA